MTTITVAGSLTIKSNRSLSTHRIRSVLVSFRSRLQIQSLQQILVAASKQLVKDMEVPLPRHLTDDPGLFQEVVKDMSTFGRSFIVELDVHVFSKTAGVVVPVGLGVSKGFQ